MGMMFWFFIAVVVGGGVIWFFNKRGSKEKVVEAKVTGKRAASHQQRGSNDDSMPTDYVVDFQVNGKAVAMLVNHSFYDSVQAGTQGKLTYKGDVFIDFENNDPRTFR